MASFRKIQNNAAWRNNIQERNSNIVSEHSQNESAYAHGKVPDISQGDGEKTKKQFKDESAYSFAKQTDDTSGDGEQSKAERNFYRNKNIWTKDINKEIGFNNSEKEWQGKDISSSGKTNHSYAVIEETLAEQSKKPRKQSNRCRIIQVVVIFVVLAMLGLIAFFIVRNFLSKGKCSSPPSIENGHVNETERSGKRIATIYCMPGYGTEKYQEITCDENGKWGQVEPCKHTGCGNFPSIQNGQVTGTEKKFNSTANLSCNNGFMYNSTVYFNCLSNGSWVSDTDAGCVPHPCGPYTLPENVNVREDLSHINMSVILKCDEGFDFKKNSDKQIQCNNNTWTGTPECEIPGTLTIETTNSPVHVGNKFDISCSLSNSARWQTLLLSRSDLSNDSVPESLYSVINNHANDYTEKRYSAKLFNKEVSKFDDGILILLSFTNAQCDDTGVYTCSVIVGDIRSPIDSKTTNKEMKVIDIKSKVKEIIASTSYVQGDDIDVLCKGLIGKDENENKLGEILVRLYWNEETNKDMNSTLEATRNIGCQVEETVKAAFVVTNAMHGAELQCIFRDDDESRDKKSVVLNVTTTKIQISSSYSRVNIGNSLNISTKLTHIRGWSTIELRKNCSGTEIAMFSFRENETISNATMEDHIILIESDIENTTASLKYHFTSVRCSDACWKGGAIEFISAVKIGDSWIKKSESIEFETEPAVPVLSLSQEKFYKGQEAILLCTGNIGIPEHSMNITKNGTIQPKPPSTSKIILMNETCENVETITFAFEVKKELNGNVYQCQINLNNGSNLLSNQEIVNVSDPILYFTDESKTGMEGSTKTIQCILTDVKNLTNVVVSRYSSEEEICDVNVTGKGACKSGEISIAGTLSDDMTTFTTIVTVHNVACNHGGLYSCKATGINTIKTSMNFQVQVSATDPVLRLPTTIVEEQKSEWEDRFYCTAHLGYPTNNRQLKIQIKRKGSSSYEDYQTSTPVKKTCIDYTSIDVRQHIFQSYTNGSLARCVVVDENNNVIKSSVTKEIRLLKNICLDGTAGNYDPHPYNCTRYIRCVGNRLYDIKCADGSCSLADIEPICNSNTCSHC